MAFTMHSHSGQFCGHAVDTLEQVVQRAIALGFERIGLSEHMPRGHTRDLYPEERGDGHDLKGKLAGLAARYDAYLVEAARLRDAYKDNIHILIGFEGEWIYGADDDGKRIKALAEHPDIDYFIGSVHHVGSRGTPIDYDKATFQEAIDVAVAKAASSSSSSTSISARSSATDIVDPEVYLNADYYDQQLEMLQTLHPRIVGHFDLVRLLSADPSRDPSTAACLATLVWPKIQRNLEFVASYGGWLECNTAALRKGLAEPYPGRAIAEAWLKLGGKFTMSDDSHGTAHVATNYKRGLAFLRSLGVTEVWTFERQYTPSPDGTKLKGDLVEKSVSLDDFEKSLNVDQ
ncbi:histidinol-phosphatase (PHP family) [Sporothrix brasiliensis 5110]|uniref:Histidinol-phosphatase n=1 Tax=Sporothrix brasiliensis 5110 TaxID=1398154 RepID=A0A0C2IV80_9PEZI|nr:histidinol-phosphatase (PHP family) [Sporothrix brasiliensis 5110]KIH88902.1 histidinol-phosphatase (PHP family) [Sporothrix brasiliensis 5110]